MTSYSGAGTDPNEPRTGPVLVTGACGLVGRATVRRLLEAGEEVVATDLDLPGNRRVARTLTAPRLGVHWADLTDPEQVDNLVATVVPRGIVHLAAIIPPLCYRHPDLARAVNVDATAALLRAAEKLSTAPRFVQASSIAVYGPRNPHRTDAVLAPDTPIRPIDVYGTHKAAAEELVRTSSLEWVVLRLGGVLSVGGGLAVNTDMLHFAAALPADGRIHTVDVRDVAAAFVSASTVTATREIFLIAGDPSHRQRQHDVVGSVTGALGLGDVFPAGATGNPDNDEDWFTTDWVDTDRSQQVLAFQHHSWPGMLDEIRAKVGWYRHLLRPAAPLARSWLPRMSPYRDMRAPFAQPWNAIRLRFGNPYPEPK
ncbi:nucleoside-diphosphate-sugar epimerase [Nocardia kruczakiae]|uniref:Nucleoside-diphosphate-sugar epimerase n=1 Tax=Nocardia kruczakiae TaxID=261477 RepID=A0ABU1XAA5_9NOCA|nr:NAD(P)-dependent oxidoreductase [Nocardia kruczakiae]MDR7167021.1 nucleoside-diphosphate-sugar epimerase [Nocardia kruczakiae]